MLSYYKLITDPKWKETKERFLEIGSCFKCFSSKDLTIARRKNIKDILSGVEFETVDDALQDLTMFFGIDDTMLICEECRAKHRELLFQDVSESVYNLCEEKFSLAGTPFEAFENSKEMF